MTIKLNDLQLILLATASQREDRSILPLPESLADQAKRVRQAITALIKRGFIVEVADVPAAKSWREEAGAHVGVVITDAGLEAIGAAPETAGEGDNGAGSSEAPDGGVVAAHAPGVPREGSKQAQLIEMLKTDSGVTITDLAEKLAWLPHTTRAALTGLKKRGHVIDSEKVDGVRRYRLAVAG